MSEQERAKTDQSSDAPQPSNAATPPAWLANAEPAEVPDWAELPRLEVSDQVSGILNYADVPGPALAPSAGKLPSAPGLLPAPPGLVVVNDDFAHLDRLKNQRTGTAPRLASIAEASATRADETAVATVAAAPVVYGMVLRNGTPDPVYEVRIEHELPTGPRFLGADPPPHLVGRRLVWEIGTLEPGARHRFKVSLQPNSPHEIPADTSALFRVYQCLHSRTRVMRPKLALSLQLPESCPVGETLRIQVEARNVGAGPADQFGLLVALPDGIASPSGPALKLQRPVLASGDSCRLEGEAVAARPGNYQIQAFAVGNGKVLVTAVAALRVEGEEPSAVGLDVEAASSSPSSPVLGDQPYLVFSVGDRWYSLPAGEIAEVRRLTDSEKHAIDLRIYAGLTAGNPRRVILTQAGMALKVDDIVGVRRFASQSWSRTGDVPWADAAAETDGRSVALIDLEKLANDASK